MSHKRCSRCKKEQEQSEFCRDSGRLDGLHPWCKGCRGSAYAIAYAKPEVRAKAVINSRRQWYKRYGLTRELFESMVAEQRGLCAICDRKPDSGPLYVDHNHATGKVRGLLCHPCNSMLGMAKDSQRTLNRAISYLIGPVLA